MNFNLIVYLHITNHETHTMRRALFLIFSLIVFSVYSAENVKYARFDHFSSKDGLSSNLVFSLTKDSTGFLWIGTDFGLDRFDGSLFKHYRKKEYPSLHRDDIYYVRHIGHNRIVFGGFGGMFQEYDRKKDIFVELMPDEMDTLGYSQMKGTCVSPSGDYYVFSTEHVFKYDEKSGRFNSHFAAYDSIHSPFISSLYVDSNNHFWLGSFNQLTIYDEQGHVLRTFDEEHDNCHPVTCVMPIDKDKIAVTFMEDEIWIFSKDDLSQKTSVSVPFKSVSKFLQGKDGRIWFATDGDGLWYADSLTENTVFNSVIPYNGTSDEIKKIYGLAEGDDGAIWIGTHNTGLWCVHPQDDYNIIFSSDFGFPANMCTSFAEDANGNLLVGTDGNGVYSVSSDLRHIQHYSLKNNNVTGICSTGDNIFVSTWGGGIQTLNIKTGISSEISYDTISNPSKIFFHVSKSEDGTIWGNTANDDLYMKLPSGLWGKLILQDDSIKNLNSKWIVRTYQGKDSYMWILATNMLWLYDGKKVKAIRPELYEEQSHSPYNIIDADTDEDGNLYVCSNNGIFRYSSDGIRFDTLSFLPDDNYRILKCGSHNRIWLASYSAIISFDPKQKNFEYLPGNYHDLFYLKSSFIDSKGRICLGTTNGFYRFNPSKIFPDTTVKHISFSSLYVARKKIMPGSSVLKDGALSEMDGIELEYWMKDIGIEVDVIDYAKYDKVQLRYRMVGLQDEWIPMKDTRTLSFNYIPTGTYTLEVEASRANMNYSYPRIALKIIVLPPWWRTWWFTLIAISLLVLGLSFYIRKKTLLLRQKMEQQTKKLNQTIEERRKLINVLSHDLNNPLFSVISSSDDEMTHLTHNEVVEMIEDKSVWEENTVLIVDKNEKTRLEIKEMLSDYFNVIVTSDGAEAVNVADSQLPDIIVSDMDKSELSMAEMAKQLYASERTKHIPILFVSSKNDAVDRLLGLLCGAIDYVVKPFSQLELLLKLTNILKVRQEHQKLIMQASMSTRMKEQTMNKDDVEKNEIHPFLQSFMEKVSECYTDSTITVDELAGKLTVSKATLTRKVKSMTGKTPMEWLMEYRLNSSFQILQNANSDKTISEVAYEVGFNDPSYFTKKFRDYYGFLPSQIGEKKK